MVATSEAVIFWAGPAFGFGMRAIATESLSITSRNTLLYPPSASFVMDTQANAFGCDSLELLHIESEHALTQLALFIPEPAAARVTEEVLIRRG